MKSRTAAAALLTLSLLLPLTACSNGSARVAKVQSSPQDLVVEVLRLRDEGKPEQAARYFISHDAYPDWNDLKNLTEVDSSNLCDSDSVKCTSAFQDYADGKECSSTTAEQVEEAGITDNNHRPVNATPVNAEDRLVNVEVVGTRTRGKDLCAFGMAQVGGHWWIANG